MTFTKTHNMKKVLLAVAVVAFLASCKKDYTCDCVDTSGIEPLFPPTSTSFDGLNNSDADAQETACTAGNGVSFYTCTWSEK